MKGHRTNTRDPKNENRYSIVPSQWRKPYNLHGRKEFNSSVSLIISSIKLQSAEYRVIGWQAGVNDEYLRIWFTWKYFQEVEIKL